MIYENNEWRLTEAANDKMSSAIFAAAAPLAEMAGNKGILASAMIDALFIFTTNRHLTGNDDMHEK